MSAKEPRPAPNKTGSRACNPPAPESKPPPSAAPPPKIYTDRFGYLEIPEDVRIIGIHYGQ